ncbi:MAG: hypothetical protein NC340_01720 [Ruminococcus flavefaciens]|nr:hypothetical protein [Ruminococcus flavefaciens]MCM1228865.1 hypothetical protein [Ruminococcus flavefaciens]
MEYKTESRNTTQFINLHDCDCRRLSYNGSEIVLEMEWIEVLGEHPENPYDTAHSTGEGLIELSDVIIIDYRSEKSAETEELFELNDIEIYSYTEYSINSEYKYAEISAYTSDDFIMLEILFKESCVKWNNLEDISWFESTANQQAEKHIHEILKMLSCNNTEEVQQEGLKLAGDIRYTGHFFQPTVDGESENLWDNCALALSQKSDKALTDYLLWCFIWIRDIACSGADRIFNRLLEYGDKGELNCKKSKAVKIAEILNDDKWLETLYRI